MRLTTENCAEAESRTFLRITVGHRTFVVVVFFASLFISSVMMKSLRLPVSISDDALLCGRSQLIHLDTNTIVFVTHPLRRRGCDGEEEPSTHADGEPMLAVRVVIGTEANIRHRAGMEHLASYLPGVVSQKAFRVIIRGETFSWLSLFASDYYYTAFVHSMAATSRDMGISLQSLSTRARRGSVLITFCSYMRDGDLASMSLERRVALEPALRRLFVETLKTESMRRYGKFLHHSDLVARNVLVDGDRLALTDFDDATFTDNEREIDALIESSIRRIITAPVHVKYAQQPPPLLLRSS